MNSEVFRFHVIRSPQSVSPTGELQEIFKLGGGGTTDFAERLRKAHSPAGRSAMLKIARAFVQSAGFIDSPQKVDAKYFRLAHLVRQKAHLPATEWFSEDFDSIFATQPGKLVESTAFKKLEASIHDSVIAAAIFETISAKTKSLLTYLAHSVHLIRQYAKKELKPVRPEDMKILIPDGIFPLPLSGQSLSDSRKKEKEVTQKFILERSKFILKLSGDLERNNNAIRELLAAFENISFDPDAASHLPKPAKGRANPGHTGDLLYTQLSRPGQGFYLPKKAAEKLSAATKEVLSKLHISLIDLNVARAVSAIEKSNSDIALELYQDAGPGKTLLRFGSVLVPFVPGVLDTIFDPGLNRPHAGPCPPVPPESAGAEETTLPVTTSNGGAKILGIADLMVVEQSLLRYDTGEIAHIENVLKSELRERKFKTSSTHEVSELTETEETEEKTKDLATTDRYELQTEAQNSISENSSRDAGVTVSASYGPSVDVSANFNYSSSSSRQESNSASSQFARDTTSRAVSRIEKRKLNRRFTSTIDVVEEVNHHRFDNQAAGSENISGVYRWLNKVLQAQVVNYGRRLMMEFIVPEPAAFLRYAMTHQPVEGITLIKPDPPGYCLGDGKTFQPLRVQDITRDNYLFWVSKYNVEDAATPPQQNIVLSQAVTGSITESETVGENHIANRNFAFDIPDGYYPVRAKVMHNELNWQSTDGDGDVDSERPLINILIDDKVVSNGQFPDLHLNAGNWKNISVAINVLNKALYAVVINVFCLLNKEKEEEWKLSIFSAIMNSYHDKKSRYETAVESARIRAKFDGISGTNPLMNRETERTELKKGCISLLTGQRFETFDSMNSNVAPYGYPEIDFTDARVDGPFIQFFEQAIEWNNMTYLFYPYFWSNKSEWVMLSQLDDEDPLFSRFLQAGAARVQVPVRPGFEESLFERIRPGFNWGNEGTLINEEDGVVDEVHLSIIQELRNQSGNNSVDGPGTVSVVQGDTIVSGTDTRFSSEDVNRRIIIQGITYVIRSVQSETQVTLRRPFSGETDTDLPYSLGGILVGQPWEIKLPTQLVKIDTNPL